VDDFNGDLGADVVLRNTDGGHRVVLLKGTAVLDQADVLGAASGWHVMP